MKIDAKLRDTVPDPEQSQLVACSQLSSASGNELKALLKCLPRLPWERDRIEPRLWVPVLDRWDLLLRQHVVERRYSSKFTSTEADPYDMVEAAGGMDDELVIEILRFTELLLQHSEKLRRAYGSLEYVSALLEADSLQVLQAALKLLRLLLKRGRPVDVDLHRRLAPLATAWSPIDPHLTLLGACKPVEVPKAPSPDVSIEFRAGTSPRGSPRIECLQVPRATLVHSPLGDIVARTVEERQLPEGACRSELRSRLLVMRALQTTEGRTCLVAVRILALGATLQTSASFQKYLQAYPGLLSELVELLRHLAEVGAPVAEAAAALLSSLVRERSPHQRQLWQLLQLSAPHGLVCSLVRAILAPPRSGEATIPPASVEAVLSFFLSCVGVSNTGAPGQSGVIACLLEFTAREGREWYPAVGLAYRAIEAIIDIISGAATSLFRDLNGQGVLAQRLAIALEGVTKHPEVPEQSAGESSEALARCWDLRHQLTLQRSRVGAILRCVLAGLRAEATRGPGVLRGPLTPLVRSLLSKPSAVGAAAFAGAASIVAHLIGDDPSCVGALIENGVIPAFLDAIQEVPDLLRAPEVFQVVATVLGAVHLHDAGEKEVREKRSPHPFEVMVKLLADPTAFRTLSGAPELHAALGGVLDEIAQNKPPLRGALVGFVITGLDELLKQARAYPAWTPPKQVEGESFQDSTEQYADRLAAFGRFLETLLAQNEVASAFAQQGGATRLVEALTMPCLPPLFAQLCPGHPLVLVFRALAQGGHLAEPAAASKPSRLIGLAGPLEDLQKLKSHFDKPLAQMTEADASQLARCLSLLGSVLSLQAAGHRDIVSLSAVQPRTLSAAATVLQEMTPALLWLFKQCSELSSQLPDPYADGGAARDTTTDYAAMMRDAYKVTDKSAIGQDEQPVLGSYTKSVLEELLWRTLFSARHFLVSVVAKQLSLPARRPNRLFVPPPALAPAARSAATNLATLCTGLLAVFAPEGADAVERQSDLEMLQKLRYLSETLELLFRAHVDEKHHHVRMLCVDRLHKTGVFGSSLDSAARYVMAVARCIARRPAPEKGKTCPVLEAMQKCMHNLTQYLDKLTSLKWIKSAPAPPTSLPPSERSDGADAAPSPAAIQQAPAPVTAGEEADATASGAPAAPEPMTGVEAATPAPTPDTAPATTAPVVTPQPQHEGSDEIDPWQLWASIAVSACRALLPFWREPLAAVVRTYPPKAAGSIVQAFLNILDDTDSRVLPDSGAAGRQAAPGGAHPQSSLSERAVQALVDMGFPRRRVEVALWNTGSASIEFAMEWLINHPEPEPGSEAPAENGAVTDAAANQGATTEGSIPAPSAADVVASALAEALTELRGSLMPRLGFLGAHVGEGSALVELATQFAHRSVPLKDPGSEAAAADLESGEAAGTASSNAEARRAANARTLFEQMLVEMQQIAKAFPPGHPVWSNPPDINQDEKEAAHCGAAFALGVSAQLLHHRPLVTNLIEKGPPGRMSDLVTVTVGLLRCVLAQREATFPKTWGEAFAQGYTFVFGNMAISSAAPDAPAGNSAISKPPAWFDAAFVTLHQASENMFLTPLPGSLSETLKPVPPQLSAEAQGELIQASLDTLALFSEAQGTTIQAALFLVRELCAVPNNAARVVAYGRAGLLLEAGGAVSVADGGGLLLLLRLPRLSRCPGLLRLVSDICGQLLEDDPFHAQQIEDQIIKLFAGSEALELRQLFDKLQPWLRTCPQLFEDVLKGLCKARTVGEGESSRVELVLAPEAERKQHRPSKSDGSNALPQQVLQKILDHLLWTVTLEAANSSEAASKKEKNNGAGASSSSSSVGATADASSQKARDGAAGKDKDKDKDANAPVHPLALPADSVLYVLQSLVSCFPQCSSIFAKSTHAAGKDHVLEDSSGGRRGQWTSMLERPAELPVTGVFIPGPTKALPSCVSVKSPLAFLIRKILASNFFASEPSQATLATLQKVAHVLAAFAAKHQETRSKVLHESVSLLKQLAHHVEAGGGHLASPRRPCSSSEGMSPAMVATRKGSGASDLLGDENATDDASHRSSSGAFAAGVGALCELLLGAMRPPSPPSPGNTANSNADPAQTRPAAGSADPPAQQRPETASSAATSQAPPSASPAPNGSAAAPASTSTVVVSPSSGFTLTEARTLRSVLCRLLAAVNLYHSDATTAANGIVRCLEHLSRPEFIDALSGSKSSSSTAGSATANGKENGTKSSAESSSVGAPQGAAAAASTAPSEDVEMAVAPEDIATTLGSAALSGAVAVERPGGMQRMGVDFDEDDSLRTPSEGGGESFIGLPAELRYNPGGVGAVPRDDAEADSDGDGEGGGAAMMGDEGEDDAGVGEGSEEGDEEFDDEGEEEEGDGAEEEGQVDEDVAEWDESEGEESEDEAGHHLVTPGPGEEAVSFIVDLGDGRSRILGRGGHHGGVPLNVPNEAADRFFQTLSGLGIPGLTISGRPRGEWSATAGRSTSWGWEGDLDLPGVHPLLVSQSASQGTGAQASGSQQVHAFNPVMFMEGPINLQGVPPPPVAVGDGAWGPPGSNAANNSSAEAPGRLGRWDAALASHLTSLLPAAPAPPAEPAPAAPAATVATEGEGTPAAQTNAEQPASGEDVAPAAASAGAATAVPASGEAGQATTPNDATAEEATGDTAMADTPRDEVAPVADPSESQMVVEPAEAPVASAAAADAGGPAPMEVDSGMPPIPSEGTPSSAHVVEPSDAASPSATPAPPDSSPKAAVPADPAPEPAAPPRAPQGLDYGVAPLRTLAASLNVTQEVVLEVAGIDPQFLEGLPPDLRDEIVMQQLSNLDLDAIRRMAIPPAETAQPTPATTAPAAATAAPPSGDGMDVTSEASGPAVPEAAAVASTEGPAVPEAAAVQEVQPMALEAASGEGASSQPTPAAIGQVAAPVATPSGDAGFEEISQDVLDALPPDIREEVLAEQARERAAAAAAAATPAADPTLAQEMDNASFIATLTPELRQEVLLTMTEEVLRSLPQEIQAEANLVRERTFQRTARARAAAEQEVAPRATAAQAGLVLGPDGQWRPARAPGGAGVAVAPQVRVHHGGARGAPPVLAAAGRGRGGDAHMNQIDLIQLLRGHLSGLSNLMRGGPSQAHRHSHSRERSLPVRPDAKFIARCDDSSLEQPIDPHQTTTVCRLLFLRRALPRALMEKLLFNLAVHPICREALLRRFLQVVVWHLPHEARGLEFPPRHLYGPASSGSSADAAELGALEACGASHVAQQVSSARVLGFLSYLLPRIPQTAEFFTKRICYREIATIVDGPDGDEYRRKKKKADHNNSCMEISVCSEAPGTDEAAINLLIRHTAPDKWPGHASSGHAQLLLLLLRTLLVPAPPAPVAEASAQTTSSAPATSAATAPAPAATEASATAEAPATPLPPAAVGDTAATGATSSDSAAAAAATASASAASAATASASAWPLKLQALLTPESAATLCAHLCASPLESGSQAKAATVVAAVMKGPADLQLKACIREELLRHVRSTVSSVEAALNASEDAYGAHLQAAGHEANFLQLLQTLQALCQEVSTVDPSSATSSGSSATAAATEASSGEPSKSPTAASNSTSAPPMTLQGILADAHAQRVWAALDAALLRTVEQWSPNHEPKSSSAAAPQAMELSGSDGANASAGATSSTSEVQEQKVAPPPLLHGLLPLLEAFFLAHGPEKKGSEQSAAADGQEANRSSTGGATPTAGGTSGPVIRTASASMALVELSREEKAALEPKTAICAFGERHKRAINALVRQAPSLLSGGFSPLMESAPWALDFDNKRHYLRQRLRALRGDSRYDVVRLHVRRSEVFVDSYRQLQMQNGEEMRGKLSVTFIGEEAMDAGGVAREWFKILAREIFNPNYALFSQAGGKACTFHPNKMSYWNPDHLRFFSFIGRIIGKALFDGHHLEAYFTRSFYKHMLRRKVHPSDMEALDPDYYKNLRWMLDNSIEGVLGHLTFTAESDEFGKVSTVELKPGGANIPVTDENKREYVQLMCEHKMTKSVQPQITAFLEGFHELVPPSLISLFDDKELELLISGLPEIDIDDLRRNTDYHNYAEATPQIQWFWKVLSEFNKEQKAWFLQFVTGTSQVPLEGFKGLIGMRGPQKFSIHRAEGGDRLPTAHTCFNQLDLPEYETEEQLRKKLVQAVHEAHEGFGFV